MKHRIRTVILAATCIIAGLPCHAAPLFEQDSVLTIELIGPITELFDDAPKRVELPFTLRHSDVEHLLKARLRGNSRLRVCQFLPLRLNFSEKSSTGTLFEDQDKIKLVTHCRNNQRGEQDLLEEYLAYRLFNLLSEVSYRVRLLQITYSDTGGKLDAKAQNRYGFVIESARELATRINATAVNVTGISRNSLDSEQAALVYIFQYLIGNTDWSIVAADSDEFCCHNGDLFAIDSDLYLVPFDFDLSGLVNTRYAKPDPSLPINRVRRRLYRGYCTDPDALQKALQSVIDKQTEIMQLPQQIPGLLPKQSENASEYLRDFFERAADQQKLLNYFQSRCL